MMAAETRDFQQSDEEFLHAIGFQGSGNRSPGEGDGGGCRENVFHFVCSTPTTTSVPVYSAFSTYHNPMLQVTATSQPTAQICVVSER